MPSKKLPTSKAAVPAGTTEVCTSKRKVGEVVVAEMAQPATKRRGRPKRTTTPKSDVAAIDSPLIAEMANKPSSSMIGAEYRYNRKTGKSSKSSSEAVKQAEKLKKANKRQAEKEKADAAQNELVAMEVNKSFAQVVEKAHQVCHISNMAGAAQVESDGGEFAGLKEMVFSDDSDSLPETELAINDKTSSPSKVKKPTLQAQVAACKASAKNKKETGKSVQLVASGLNAAWLANLGNKLPQVSPKRAAIDNEAVQSTRPDFPPSPLKFDHHATNATIAKTSQCDLRRANTLVSVPADNISVTLPPVIKTSWHGYQAYIKIIHINWHKEGGLYTSLKLFDDFAKNSPAFLALSLATFKKIWPNIDFELEPDNTLYLIAWGPDGSPIFYENPVARNGLWNPKDPNYKPNKLACDDEYTAKTINRTEDTYIPPRHWTLP
ncbi:hypothetical protein BDN71DRAFT_1435019 [Pleurotus eryngii]|uniref:Uncharacterized protein n=1 Tax=Pleurotus eryngii TaxID=5323 RepID=A0A9P5ZQE6_PLEER|nr:hypothetical protein BDN71DRAFT_1435019 [Pleurotus eryngii]